MTTAPLREVCLLSTSARIAGVPPLGRSASAWTFSLLLVVRLALAATVVNALLSGGIASTVRPTMVLAWIALSALVVVGVWLVMVKWRGFSAAAIGLEPREPALGKTLAGLLLGLGSVGAVAGIGLVTGALHLGHHPPSAPLVSTVVLGFLSVALTALYQQVLTSSGLFSALRAGFGDRLAIGVCSLLFTLIHLALPGADIVSTTNTALFCVASILLFLGPRGSRPSLALPVALHAAWNWGIAFLLGLPLSGMRPPWSFVAFESRGSYWLGGDYGPEAGLGTTVVFSAIVGLAWWRCRRSTCSGG